MVYVAQVVAQDELELDARPGSFFHAVLLKPLVSYLIQLECLGEIDGSLVAVASLTGSLVHGSQVADNGQIEDGNE